MLDYDEYEYFVSILEGTGPFPPRRCWSETLLGYFNECNQNKKPVDLFIVIIFIKEIILNYSRTDRITVKCYYNNFLNDVKYLLMRQFFTNVNMNELSFYFNMDKLSIHEYCMQHKHMICYYEWSPECHNYFSSRINKVITTLLCINSWNTVTNEPTHPESTMHVLSLELMYLIFEWYCFYTQHPDSLENIRLEL